MPNKRLEMHSIKQIQELKKQGRTGSEVARILQLDRATVRRYWNRCENENENENRFNSQWANCIDLEYLKKEIAQGVPKKILYEEQHESHNLPSYQAFCRFLSRHNIGEKAPEVSIKQNRNPGDSTEVDYSGNGWIIHCHDEGSISVELFVGVLSYSTYTFAEFTLTQKLRDFIESHVRMFSFFGGVSRYGIPDNCKTAVTKTDKYDPKIHPTYLDMCNYYEITVDPADPASPQHKPNVERAIRTIQQDFYPRIRKRRFTSLMELNRELKQWLGILNSRPIRGRGQSREFFLGKEREFLRPLPSTPYELFYFKKAKVHPDCHFQHKKNYYSVPWRYTGKEVDLKFNHRIIHAYHQCERIASHAICKGTWHYTTEMNHYPEKKFVDANYHLIQIRKQSLKLGPNVNDLIEGLIRQAKHPLKILRKAQGIIGLSKTFSKEAMDYACETAIEFSCLNYYNIKKFAESYQAPREDILNEVPKREIEYMHITGGNDEDKDILFNPIQPIGGKK